MGVADKDVQIQSLLQYHFCCGDVGVLQGIYLNKSKYPPVNSSGKPEYDMQVVGVWFLPLVMHRAHLYSVIQEKAEGNTELESLNISTLL